MVFSKTNLANVSGSGRVLANESGLVYNLENVNIQSVSN